MAVTSAQVKTPVGSAPVIPLVILGIGAYLAWFGIHYWKRGTWPVAPVKSLLTGKGVPAPGAITPSADEQAVEAEWQQANAAQQAGSSGGGSTGSQVSAGTKAAVAGAGTAGANQSLAQMLAISMGHSTWASGAEWDDWVKLWNQESGWDNTADNTSSGAYGIAQALGHGTSGSAGCGRNEYGGGGLTDAEASQANCGNARYQIVWGINYIAGTYGSPSAAWAHEVADNWY